VTVSATEPDKNPVWGSVLRCGGLSVRQAGYEPAAGHGPAPHRMSIFESVSILVVPAMLDWIGELDAAFHYSRIRPRSTLRI
jgi:hypothetical protein